jgi:Zn-dependent protease with chaperone function
VTLALVLITSGLTLVAFGHQAIRRVSGSGTDPRVIIVMWLIALAAGPGMLAAGVAVLLLPDHAGLGGLLRSAGGCLVHLGGEVMPTREEATGLAGLTAIVLLLARTVVVAVRLTRVRRQRLEHHRFLVALATAPDHPQGATVRMLQHSRPIAYSVGGDGGMVVVSRGLKESLTPDAFAAAVEHERAHLKGKHHWMLASVDILAAALPIAPLLREAPKDLRVLVEYAADTSAALRWGGSAVRSALLAVAGSSVPDCALGMAGGAINDRLARLQTPLRHPSPIRRHLRCSLAGAATALAPLLASVAVFLLVACPTA